MLLPPSQIVLHRARVIRALCAVALFLAIANAFGVLLRVFTSHDNALGLIEFFDFSTERNLPTFFSGCLFLCGAGLLYIVSRVRPQLIWRFLAGLFVFLAFDEMFQVHERFIRPIRERFHLSGFLYLSWVIVYGAAVLVLAVPWFAVWRRLPGRPRRWLGWSAATYLTGAIGFEMLGAPTWEAMDATGSQFNIVSSALSMVEESLEMAGLIMLIYALFVLLQSEREGCAIVIPPEAPL